MFKKIVNKIKLFFFKHMYCIYRIKSNQFLTYSMKDSDINKHALFFKTSCGVKVRHTLQQLTKCPNCKRGIKYKSGESWAK